MAAAHGRGFASATDTCALLLLMVGLVSGMRPSVVSYAVNPCRQITTRWQPGNSVVTCRGGHSDTMFATGIECAAKQRAMHLRSTGSHNTSFFYTRIHNPSIPAVDIESSAPCTTSTACYAAQCSCCLWNPLSPQLYWRCRWCSSLLVE
jgi:hypothetical protein